VTAELPAHFAESLGMLGFEAMAGDMMPIDTPDPAKSTEVKMKRVAAAAKTARKARKGERRSRGAAPVGKPSGKPPSKGGKPVARKPARKPR
jgi:23S rRNA pseudouridine955/2504/2580 synthase